MADGALQRDEAPGTIDDVLRRIRDVPLGDDPAAMREAFARRAGPQPQGTAVRVGRIEALEAGRGPTLLWLHGGGYVFGAPETHMAMAAAIAEGGVRVVMPRYRLAPEARWPAPLADALAAFDALDGPVAVGGDSAGGHLALNVAFRRRARCLALVSPNTDRTGLSRTRARNTPFDAMNDDAGDHALSCAAFDGHDLAHPDASPLLGDLSRLPPTWITACTDEVLLDDALLLACSAARAGVPVDLRVRKGLFHMWPLWPHAIEEGRGTAAEIAAFVRLSRG